MTDRELIRKVHSGNKEALNEIIQKYYDDIYRFCFFLTGQKEDAYDITQETFLRFIKYINAYRSGNLKGYLFMIARNLCNDYFRVWHSNQEVVNIEDMDDLEIEDNAFTRLDDQASFYTIFRKIPKEQREVLILRFYHELKFSDIAKVVGSNVSTVKSRYRLGLKNMKKEMEEQGL